MNIKFILISLFLICGCETIPTIPNPPVCEECPQCPTCPEPEVKNQEILDRAIAACNKDEQMKGDLERCVEGTYNLIPKDKIPEISYLGNSDLSCKSKCFIAKDGSLTCSVDWKACTSKG